MEKAFSLLQGLADKLCTTVDHLWGVLLVQAKVTIVYDICWIALTIFIVFITYKVYHYGNRYAEKIKAENRVVHYSLEKDPDVFLPVFLALAVLSMVFTLESIFSVKEIITCYINPDFWALQQILHSIGK